MIIFGTIINL